MQFDSKFVSKQQISQDWHHFVIFDVDPDFTNLTHYGQDTRGKANITIKHTHSVLAQYRPLLASPKGGLIEIQTGMKWWGKWMEKSFLAGYFGHNELNQINLSIICYTHNC